MSNIAPTGTATWWRSTSPGVLTCFNRDPGRLAWPPDRHGVRNASPWSPLCGTCWSVSLPGWSATPARPSCACRPTTSCSARFLTRNRPLQNRPPAGKILPSRYRRIRVWQCVGHSPHLE